jgi:hypothetical protein
MQLHASRTVKGDVYEAALKRVVVQLLQEADGQKGARIAVDAQPFRRRLPQSILSPGGAAWHARDWRAGLSCVMPVKSSMPAHLVTSVEDLAGQVPLPMLADGAGRARATAEWWHRHTVLILACS